MKKHSVRKSTRGRKPVSGGLKKRQASAASLEIAKHLPPLGSLILWLDKKPLLTLTRSSGGDSVSCSMKVGSLGQRIESWQLCAQSYVDL